MINGHVCTLELVSTNTNSIHFTLNIFSASLHILIFKNKIECWEIDFIFRCKSKQVALILLGKYRVQGLNCQSLANLQNSRVQHNITNVVKLPVPDVSVQTFKSAGHPWHPCELKPWSFMYFESLTAATFFWHGCTAHIMKTETWNSM